MGNNLKDVMIALHPPSLDRCKEVVGAWFPPAGSAGHICGCKYYTFEHNGGFFPDENGGMRGPRFHLLDPKSPKFSVEAQDWDK